MRTNNDSDINVINNINIFYNNQMSNSHKTDERVLKEIVLRNVSCVNNNDERKLIIYYKNKRVNQLVMNNNQTKKTDSLQQTNVIFEFSCPKEDCKLLQNIKYIGILFASCWIQKNS